MSASLATPLTKTILPGLISRWTRPPEMQEADGCGEVDADGETLIQGQPSLFLEHARQCFRFVGRGVDMLSGHLVVGRFHDIVDPACPAPNMKNLHEIGMQSRDGGKSLKPLEFAVQR